MQNEIIDPLKLQILSDCYKLEAELIKEAWQAQNACNLSGVVFSFNKAMIQLCEITRHLNHGTQWRNEHMICKLYASKIAQLAGDLPLDHWVYKE